MGETKQLQTYQYSEKERKNKWKGSRNLIELDQLEPRLYTNIDDRIDMTSRSLAS